MKAKRVRFKDSEIEPNYHASSKFDASSAPCEPREEVTMPPAALNEPKTSEFAFFKRLKQSVGHTSCQNTQNRHSIPVRNCGPTSHTRELDKLKHKDVNSSQQIKKPKNGEIDSFLNHRNAALESSAMTRKEHDNEGFNCSSPIKTPTSISLDSFFSATANASVNPENLQQDGDIFLSKRLKLRQQIAKTLFPETHEVPKECDWVYMLLSRLLPETSQETLSLDPPERLQETKESNPLDLDSNILLEASDTSRKLVKASKDHLLDSRVSTSWSHRIWGAHPADQIDEGLDTSVARNSYRMLLEYKEEDEWQSSLNGIASGCWSSRFGDGNLLTWGTEIHDYSMTGSTIQNIAENETYKHSSYDAYGNSQLCTFRDQSHSYELSGSYGFDAAAIRNDSLIYKHEIHDFDLDRGPLPPPNCLYDSCSLVPFKRSRPVAKNLRYCTEPNYLSDFETRREPQPLLLGWDTNELDKYDPTHNSHMELEIYCPPSSTYNEDCQDSPGFEPYCGPSSRWSKNHRDSLENSTMMHWCPNTCQDHDFQGYLTQQNGLVLRSPYAPFRLSYGQEQLDTEDSGLFNDLSKAGSFFFIPQKSNYSLENTIYERNCPDVEASPISKDFEYDAGLKCKSLTGILKEQYEYTDNALEHFGREHSSSPLLIASENSLATIQPERWSLASVHLPIECDQEDSFPLQCHTIEWK